MAFFSSSLFKAKKIPVLFFFIFLSFLLSSLSPERQSSIKNKVIFLFSPFQRAVSKLNTNISNSQKGGKNAEKLQQQNQIISQKLFHLEAEARIWQELAKENKRLRELLGFRKNNPLSLIPARVVGRDATNWNKVIFIDKGSTDGLKYNLPVITPRGLVGQIIGITPYQSKVMTVLDSNCRVAALVEENRVQGIICGTNDFWCLLNYISLREEIKKGDSVISSGQGGVFPKGLLIGRVSSVKKKETELFQRIKVNPAVNFSQLEEVMVIAGKE